MQVQCRPPFSSPPHPILAHWCVAGTPGRSWFFHQNLQGKMTGEKNAIKNKRMAAIHDKGGTLGVGGNHQDTGAGVGPSDAREQRAAWGGLGRQADLASKLALPAASCVVCLGFFEP